MAFFDRLRVLKVITSDNTVGNPYHDEHSGKFTSKVGSMAEYGLSTEPLGKHVPQKAADNLVKAFSSHPDLKKAFAANPQKVKDWIAEHVQKPNVGSGTKGWDLLKKVVNDPELGKHINEPLKNNASYTKPVLHALESAETEKAHEETMADYRMNAVLDAIKGKPIYENNPKLAKSVVKEITADKSKLTGEMASDILAKLGFGDVPVGSGLHKTISDAILNVKEPQAPEANFDPEEAPAPAKEPENYDPAFVGENLDPGKTPDSKPDYLDITHLDTVNAISDLLIDNKSLLTNPPHASDVVKAYTQVINSANVTTPLAKAHMLAGLLGLKGHPSIVKEMQNIFGEAMGVATKPAFNKTQAVAAGQVAMMDHPMYATNFDHITGLLNESLNNPDVYPYAEDVAHHVLFGTGITGEPQQYPKYFAKMNNALVGKGVPGKYFPEVEDNKPDAAPAVSINTAQAVSVNAAKDVIDAAQQKVTGELFSKDPQKLHNLVQAALDKPNMDASQEAADIVKAMGYTPHIGMGSHKVLADALTAGKAKLDAASTQTPAPAPDASSFFDKAWEKLKNDDVFNWHDAKLGAAAKNALLNGMNAGLPSINIANNVMEAVYAPAKYATSVGSHPEIVKTLADIGYKPNTTPQASSVIGEPTSSNIDLIDKVHSLLGNAYWQKPEEQKNKVDEVFNKTNWTTSEKVKHILAVTGLYKLPDAQQLVYENALHNVFNPPPQDVKPTPEATPANTGTWTALDNPIGYTPDWGGPVIKPKAVWAGSKSAIKAHLLGVMAKAQHSDSDKIKVKNAIDTIVWNDKHKSAETKAKAFLELLNSGGVAGSNPKSKVNMTMISQALVNAGMSSTKGKTPLSAPNQPAAWAAAQPANAVTPSYTPPTLASGQEDASKYEAAALKAVKYHPQAGAQLNGVVGSALKAIPGDLKSDQMALAINHSMENMIGGVKQTHQDKAFKDYNLHKLQTNLEGAGVTPGPKLVNPPPSGPPTATPPTPVAPTPPPTPTKTVAELTADETSGYKIYKSFDTFKSTIPLATLTNAEREAVEAYQGYTYTHINDALRQSKPMTKTLTSYVKNLDSAIAKSGGLTEDTVLYRGISGARDIYKLGVGDKWSSLIGKCVADHGFMSTSIGKDFAKNWSSAGENNIVLQIRAPKGTKGIIANAHTGMHHGEKEFLLARGTFLTIKGMRNEGGYNIITADVT